MQNLILILSLFIITACGLQKKQMKKVNIHPEAQSYVATFEEKHGVKINDLEVTFRPLEAGTNVLAYCQQGEKHVQVNLEDRIYKTPLIVINSNYWDTKMKSPADRELLLYHELGHCILKRMHTDTLGSDGFPSSVMNAYHLGATTYTSKTPYSQESTLYPTKYGYYISELFHNNNLARVPYTSTAYASRFPAFEEPNIEVLKESEIKDCVNEKELEVIKVETEEELETEHGIKGYTHE